MVERELRRLAVRRHAARQRLQTELVCERGIALIFYANPAYLSWREARQTQDGDLRVRLDLVVIRRIRKRQWKHALLFQVGFYNKENNQN